MKKHARYLAPLLVLASLSACGLAPEERYERAQDSFAQSDFVTARLDLISALEEEPGNASYLKLLAQTQIAMNDGEGALFTLERLAALRVDQGELDPLRAEAEVLRGRFDEALSLVKGLDSAQGRRIAALAYIGLKDQAAARASLEAGLAAAPKDADLLATFARFELATGNLAGARTHARSALKTAPDHHDALLVSAQVDARANRLSDALRTYDKALKSHPSSLELRMGKVAALGDLDRIEEASALLEETAKLAPGNEQVVFLQARMAIAQKDWAKARELLQGSEQQLRANPHLQIIYAQALLNLGQPEQARAWLEPLIRRYPSQRFARTLLAETQLRSADPKAAFDTMASLSRRPDATPEELGLAAQAAKKIGHPSAKELARRATMPAPEWFGGEMAKADTAMREGNWARASAIYESINQRLKRPNAIVLNNLAYAKGRQGQTDEAVRIALQAVAAAPENASVLDTAGVLLIETGQDPQRGKALLAKAARLAPDNPTIARNLAQAL